MSYNVIPLETISIIPEKFDYKEKKKLEILNAGEAIQHLSFAAQQPSTTSNTIQCNPPGRDFVVDNNVWQYLDIFVALTATNNDVVNRSIFEEIGRSGAETAPRAYPLSRVQQNVKMVVNTGELSTNLNDYIDLTLPYGVNRDIDEFEQGTTPTLLDNVYNYNLSYNKGRDVINQDYFQSGYQKSRGSFVDFQIAPINTAYTLPNAISNPIIAPAATGTAVFRLRVYEKLRLSPLFYQQVGFVNVQTMQYVNTFGDLSQLICRRTTCPLGTSLTPSSYSALINEFKLDMTFYTPKLLDKIPKAALYDYTEIDVQTYSASTLAIAQTGGFTMSAVNLNAIPKRLYISVEEVKNDLTFSQGGLYKPNVPNSLINSISLTWNGQNGYLTNMTARQLYEMSVDNGLDMSWDEYSKWKGSVICVDIAKNLGLKSNQAVGLLSLPQLGMQVNATNLSDRQINFALKVVVMYDGVLTILNGSINKQTGLLSSMDAIKSIEQKEIVEPANTETGPVGQRIGGFNPMMLASLFKEAAKKGVDIAEKITPVVKKGINIAEQLGLGDVEQDIEDDTEMRALKQLLKKKQGAKIGGKMSKGGRMITRDMLY